jgi:hypothetical protein
MRAHRSRRHPCADAKKKTGIGVQRVQIHDTEEALMMPWLEVEEEIGYGPTADP